jgi:hypothetical protein
VENVVREMGSSGSGVGTMVSIGSIITPGPLPGRVALSPLPPQPEIESKNTQLTDRASRRFRFELDITFLTSTRQEKPASFS